MWGLCSNETKLFRTKVLLSSFEIFQFLLKCSWGPCVTILSYFRIDENIQKSNFEIWSFQNIHRRAQQKDRNGHIFLKLTLKRKQMQAFSAKIVKNAILAAAANFLKIYLKT